MAEKRIYRRRLYDAHVDLTRQQFEPPSLESEVRQYRARWGKFLPQDLDAPILDVGCGCGQFLYFLQRIGYHNVYGVDASSPSVEMARRIGVRQVELGDGLTYLRRHSDYFAVISAQHFLEHFTPDEVLEILDAAYAALRPEGILMAVVPNAASPFGTYTRYWDPGSPPVKCCWGAQ